MNARIRARATYPDLSSATPHKKKKGETILTLFDCFSFAASLFSVGQAELVFHIV